jgi:uracil-DNA glycosylase
MKRGSGWESITQSAECDEVLAKVADRRTKERVYPVPEDVFRAFEDCSFKKVRVVILGQDPYANEGQAIGRAFAVPESTKKVPRSLKNIFEEVGRNYPRQSMPKPTLESWAKQGVFLLNTTLTVAHGDPDSHAPIGWQKAVTIPALKKLSDEREHLVFMLWGNRAKLFERFLDQRRHLVLEASHPSPLSVKRFQRCGQFRKANDYLSEYGIDPIIWTNGT